MTVHHGKLSGTMILIVAAAAIAGLLFGYDAGVISGALLFIKESFSLSPTAQGLVVSAVSFGAAWSFGIFLIIAIIATIYFYSAVPENKGVSLETIEANLKAGKHTRDLGI